MTTAEKEVSRHLHKTTNTIILDYLLWLSARTILRESSGHTDDASSPAFSTRSKGRRLVGLVDGLILTFDQTNRPKFSYEILTRRLNFASLVILFVYRDSQSQYITRRSSESRSHQALAAERDARTSSFLKARDMRNVLQADEDSDLIQRFDNLRVPAGIHLQTRNQLGSDGLEGQRNISLRDALHQFMLVSANSYASSKKSPAKIWIAMAVKFCLFAALEGYLLLGEQGTDYLNSCYSYGAMPNPDYGHADIDALFAHDSKKHGDFSRTWERVRQESLGWFIPSAQNSLEQHLLVVLCDCDFAGFKAEVKKYLSAVLECMPDPELCKYPSALDEHVLRAPGMISIAHESDSERATKRAKVSA